MERHEEHSIVSVTVNINDKVRQGMLGTVVHCYSDGETYEVEFIVNGGTVTVETIKGLFLKKA